MTLRLRDPFKAMVLSAFILMAAKLAACVVARFVYGPDFMERGYVAADWRTAKLMISLTWSTITVISAACFTHACWRFEQPAVVTQAHTPPIK
jgi:multisubunit Na+/H+ antiporter MnhF subunit